MYCCYRRTTVTTTTITITTNQLQLLPKYGANGGQSFRLQQLQPHPPIPQHAFGFLRHIQFNVGLGPASVHHVVMGLPSITKCNWDADRAHIAFNCPCTALAAGMPSFALCMSVGIFFPPGCNGDMAFGTPLPPHSPHIPFVCLASKGLTLKP